MTDYVNWLELRKEDAERYFGARKYPPFYPEVNLSEFYPEVNVTAFETKDPKEPMACDKPLLALIPPVAAETMATALALGARKYGTYSWRRTSVRAMTYLHAALRHIYAYIDRADIDPESGASHLGHAMASLAILIDAAKANTLVDDRPEVGNVA